MEEQLNETSILQKLEHTNFDDFLKDPVFKDFNTKHNLSIYAETNVLKNLKSNSITIDVNTANKISYGNSVSYNFYISRNNKNSNSIENLVVIKTKDMTSAFIVEYSSNKNYARRTSSDMEQEFDQVEVKPFGDSQDYQLQEFLRNHKMNGSSSSCRLFTFTEYQNCTKGGVGHTYQNRHHCICQNGDNSCRPPSKREVSVRICDPNDNINVGNSNQNSGSDSNGIGGSGNGGYSPNEYDAVTVLTRPEEMEYQIFLDPSFENSFANCSYKLLTENNLLKNILKKLIPKDSEYDVTFKVEKTTATGGTTRANYGPNGDIVVTINKDLVDTGNIVSISETILHEAVHAKLFEMVKSIGGLDKLNEFTNEDSEIGKLAACYNKYGRPELQHEFIWENYVKEIAIGTETIHKLFPENYNRFHDYMNGTIGYTKDSFYESVAKAGLNKTSYFKKLDTTKQQTLLLLYGSLKVNGKKLSDYKNCE